MKKEVYLVINRQSGEVIKELSENEEVVCVEREVDEGKDDDKSGGHNKADNSDNLRQLTAGKDEKYVKVKLNNEGYVQVKYSNFIKVNQAAIFDILRADFTSTQIRLYLAILAFLGYFNVISHSKNKKPIQTKFVASALNVSERKIKEGLKALSDRGIIQQTGDGYFLNFRYAVRGNYVNLDTFEQFSKINMGDNQEG